MDIFFGITGALLAAMLLTSFVKILTALNILRYGLGLADAPFGLVMVGVACALSLVVMNPQISASGGIDGVLKGAPVSIEQSYRPFLERHAEKGIVERLGNVQKKISKSSGLPEKIPASPGTPFTVLIAAFLISELSAAFTVGIMMLVPFVVIDLAVGNLLMALGVTQLSQQVVALPIKLLLFVAVSGWELVSEKLLGSYI